MNELAVGEVFSDALQLSDLVVDILTLRYRTGKPVNFGTWLPLEPPCNKLHQSMKC